MADCTIKKGLKRGEVARHTGCNSETIRYYEKIGLLSAPPRNPNGYRVYDDILVRRLRFILRGRELGFTIEEIRGLLELADCGGQSCSEVQARTEHHLSEVRAKITDLRRIATILARTAAQCADNEAPGCPILDALAA